MELFSRIVVPLDGSKVAERALPVAAALATMTRAPITLVTVAVHDDHVPTAERVLCRAALQLDQRVDTEVLVGLPVARMLLAYLHPDRGAVVVMSTHARTAVGELLLGSVADELVRRSPVPVVLVGPHVNLPERGATYKELIACLDGSDDAERLLPIVTCLQRELGVHPWLFEVLTEAAVPSASPEGDVLETNYVHRAANGLRRDGVEADWDVGHDDDRARAIVSFAAVRVAPIVALATHGRDPIGRLATGSVTVTVARSASCPVLVIGPAFAAVAATVR